MNPAILIWLFLITIPLYSQTVVGTWQVAHEGNCLGDVLAPPTETETELTREMNSMAKPTSKIVQFNPDNSGEQNWKQVGKKKSSAREKFLYKASGQSIYFLDKKSRLITDTFIIEILTTDSLILFNKDRSCERLELVRVK